jgi:hypothetical protein
MTDIAEQSSAATEPLATDDASQLNKANKYALSLWAGARSVLLDEMIFAANEYVERAVAETRIFNEYASKLANAHSVKDIAAMCQECTKHQLDFIRRDTERVLRHSERAIDNAAKLAESLRRN